MKQLLVLLFVSLCWLGNAFGQTYPYHQHSHITVREQHIPDKEVPSCVYNKFHVDHPTSQADKWFRKADKYLVVFRENSQWHYLEYNNTPFTPCVAQISSQGVEIALTSTPQNVQTGVNYMRTHNDPTSQFHRFFGSQVQCVFKLPNGNYEVDFILTSAQKVAVEFNGFDTFPNNVVQEIDFN
jgi:hypothetical protein